MVIEVDCNNDRITVGDYHPVSDGLINSFDIDVKNPIKFLKFLEEIFNRIDFHGAHETIDIKLVKIDEDTSTTIGEW